MSQHHKHGPPAQASRGKTTTTTQADVAAGDKDHNAPLVSVEEIRLCAYRKWEIAGKPTGKDVHYWLEAEQESAQQK